MDMEWEDTNGQNIGVELHDSELVAIRQDGSDLVLTLSPAWIHCSSGEPGRDPGTSWTRDASIRIEKGRTFGKLPGLPADIPDGSVVGPDWAFHNVIPSPEVFQGPVRMELFFNDGSKLVIAGDRILIELVGEAEFMYVFPSV
jgi:hypothetical protein